ncbi:MAG: DNA helicase [Sneathiella sp.]
MKLSAPLHVLKQRAKENKRAQSIPLSAALNAIAKAEGFASWSLLQSKMKDNTAKLAAEHLASLHPGDLVLIGARPGLGKTTLALELLLQARRQDQPCFFFSLEYRRPEIQEKLSALDGTYVSGDPNLLIDVSEKISASYIIEQTERRIQPGSLIAIDYLQLLDQQRQKPALQTQVNTLKEFAKSTGCVVIFISQIDRSFNPEAGPPPGKQDIRLPNPLDLNLFNKTIFAKDQQVFAA